MAVKPPQDDDEDPDTIAFGIAALDARLDETDLEYPATPDEVVDALSNTAIPYDATGNTVDLATALEGVPIDRFDSESELLDALHPVFEEHRSRTSNSVLGQLRALLPF